MPSHRRCSATSATTSKHPPPKSSNSSPPKSLLFSTILFCLVLTSCLLHAISSVDPTYFIVADGTSPALLQLGSSGHGRRFTGRRFLSAAGVVLRSSAGDSERIYGSMVEGDENLLCDRSHHRTDVCVARGDVRVVGTKIMVMAEGGHDREEKLRPYTRKWEDSVMRTIDEVVMEKRVVRSGVAIHRYREAVISPTSGHLFKESNDSHGTLDIGSNWTAIPACDVRHDVPAIVFSTGGYTGNVYHEFNDGIIPLFLTAAHLKGEVVLMVLEYHPWWMTKYAEIVSQISRYDVVDMANDGRVHCFREVKVGLHIHDELTIDSTQQERMPEAMVLGADVVARRSSTAPESRRGKGKDEDVDGADEEASAREQDASRIRLAALTKAAVTMADFRAMLRAAYLPRLTWRRTRQWRSGRRSSGDGAEEVVEMIMSGSFVANSSSSSEPPPAVEPDPASPLAAEGEIGRRKPKLVMVLRESPRAMVNQEAVRMAAEEIGFEVEMIRPRPTTEMVDIYEALQGCDAMMGVHGAAMTHLLFMRPGATFIQVVPLGTQWAAETYYGRPAAEGMGLRYVAYEVSAEESSLSRAYPLQHPILSRPDLVNAQGWSHTKRIYLDSQDLILSLPRFRPTLLAAYAAAPR